MYQAMKAAKLRAGVDIAVGLITGKLISLTRRQQLLSIFTDPQ